MKQDTFNMNEASITLADGDKEMQCKALGNGCRDLQVEGRKYSTLDKIYFKPIDLADSCVSA
jgi:hypothetical protein